MTNGPHETDAEFSAYVAAHADRVRLTAYLLCGDWHEAEDLAQTAFVRLYVAWNRVDRTEPIDAYVRIVTAPTERPSPSINPTRCPRPYRAGNDHHTQDHAREING